MLRSTWQRRNESMIVTLGHKEVEGGIQCDVVLVDAHTPAHDLELEDDQGQVFHLDAPENWFEQKEPRRYFGVALRFADRPQ